MKPVISLGLILAALLRVGAATNSAMSFQTLPSAQGWSWAGSPALLENQVYSVDGTKLTQNTLGFSTAVAGYQTTNRLVFGKPFSIIMRARVMQSQTVLPQNGDPHSGLKLAVLLGSEQFSFSFDDQVIVLYDYPAGSFPINGTVFHDYQMDFFPGALVRLLVDNVVLFSQAPPVSNFEFNNRISFGEMASTENAKFEMTRFEIIVSDPTLPPEIAVDVQPSHTNIVDGGGQAFGNLYVDGAASLTFAIKNTGTTFLSGLGTTIDGPNQAEFAVTSSPVAPVNPNGATTLTVQFAPTSRGPKTAALHINSNDPDESPFDIILTGMGLGITSQPLSRVVSQGTQVSFSVAVEGPVPSFQWLKDRVEIPGANGSTLFLPSAQPWQIGSYYVRVSSAAGLIGSDTATLGLIGVPSEIWRGLVACYQFNGNVEDACRPGKPASFVSTAELVTDPQRGGVANIRGKGFGVPPDPSEAPDEQGPGGYLQIPRPAVGAGEPFTVSLLVKEEGFSIWHGESFVTMGEGGSSVDLVGHYWVGSLEGTDEHYGGNGVAVFPYDSNPVLSGSAVALDIPWTSYTVVAEGDIVRLYRDGQLMGNVLYKKDTLGDFVIGRHWWANGGNYSTRLLAKVDDLRIYNRALTGSEVQQLHSVAQTTPPSGSFESWVLIYGFTGTDAALTADPDHDRMSNWEEYCFGTSPTDGAGSAMNAVVVGSTLTLQWLQRAGVAYNLRESSTLLSPWNASSITPTLSADQSSVPAGYQRVQVSAPLVPAGPPAGNRFFRVEATRAP